MDSIKIDYKTFYRNIKFALYRTLQNIDFEGFIPYEVTHFFFITYKYDGSVKLKSVIFPIDSKYIKYRKDAAFKVDLTKLAKYVGEMVLEKCRKEGVESLVLNDYTNISSHGQVVSLDDNPNLIPLVRYIIR